jgi:hypothetical protein
MGMLKIDFTPVIGRVVQGWYNKYNACVSMELDGHAVNALSAIAEVKQHYSVIGWVTDIYYLELLRTSEGTFSRSSRLH